MATTDSVPREPSAFRPSNHFAERFKGRNYDDRPPRHLDGEIINGCISRGTTTRQGSGIVWFRETFAGVTYRLVANVDKGVVVTGYPISVNTKHARESGRWSAEQIDDIREFIATDPRTDKTYHE